MKPLLSFLSVLLLVLVISYQGYGSVVYVNQAATGNRNGSSWANAYTSLELAIAAALSGDQIWVAAGTYKPGDGYDRTASFQLKKGVKIFGGFAGSETVLTARNYEGNPTILSGEVGIKNYSQDNVYHVIYLPSGSGLDTTAVLDGFTIKGGYANGDGHQHLGAGIYSENNAFKIKNCKIIENSADNADAKANGAGIYLSSSNISIENCQISNNSCAWNGGGIFITNSSPTITNCLITKNSAVYGGGIFLNSAGNSLFTNATIANNSVSDSGGGLYAVNGGSGTFNNCIFWANVKNGNSNEIYLFGGSHISLNYSCYANSVHNEGDFTNNNCIKNNPLFADNYLLSPGSPCINGGNDALNTSAYDLAGHARKIFTIDMGAYESTYCTQNYTVSNNADSGTGSLRWAMDNICDGGTITFASDMTITLTTELAIGLKSLNIDGTGKNITVSGNNVCRVFHITGVTGKTYNIKGLIISNANAEGSGGGLWANTVDGGTLNVANCTFSGNKAYFGAGAYTENGCTFTNCTFSGNTADFTGGGIYCWQNVNLANCKFNSNHAKDGGGAGTFSGGTFTNCEFTSNTATSNGGGGYAHSGGEFTNCTFNKNTATTNGGGVYAFSGGIFTNCSLSGNTASSGGGAKAGYGGLFTNCLFWNAASSEISVAGTGMSFTYCAVKGGYTGQGAGTGIVPLTSNPFKSETDLSLNLINDGGLSCLGSGNNDANQTSFDIAGNARKMGRIDIGAYESLCIGNAYTVVSSADDGLGSLRWAMENICEGGIITFATDMNITLYSELVISSKSLTIDGTGKKITISGNNKCRVFNISRTCNIINLNITKGYGDYGGGILMIEYLNHHVNIEKCTFNDNYATTGGGGAWVMQGGTFTDCSFNGNTSGEASAVRVLTGSTFTNCSFGWNKKPPYYRGKGVISINQCRFTNCIFWNILDKEIEDDGSSVFNYCAVRGGYPGTGNVKLLESPFISETDLSLNLVAGGGALCLNSGNNEANFSETDLAGNPRKNGAIDMGAYESTFCQSNIMITSDSFDGGIALQVAIDNICDGGTITFAPDLKIMLTKEIHIGPKSVYINGTGNNITISGNDACRVFSIQGVNGKTYRFEGLTISNGFASEGSGLLADLTNGNLHVTNCVFNSNQATANGGAVKTKGGNFTNCTFSANYAVSKGSGVYASGGSTFTNCVLYNNGSSQIYVDGTGPIFTYCAVKNGFKGTGNVTLTQMPFVDMDVNPGLNTNPGGGLLCIDAGLNSANILATDIRGEARIQHSIIDMGAIEWVKLPGEIETGTSSFNLWPIKAYDRNMNIVINGMGDKGNKVMVSNIIGQVVFHGFIQHSKAEIPVNRKGVYLVNVIPENGSIYNGKVVVK